MRLRLRLRGCAALAAIGFVGATSAAQAHDLTCTVRGGYHEVRLRFADQQASAAFGDDPASPTIVTEDLIKWSGPENEHGYAPKYVFDRNTGVLTRMTPRLFNNGLTSMWPSTYDCAGSPTRVE